MDYSLWGCKELDMTKQLSMHAHIHDFSKYFSIICIITALNFKKVLSELPSFFILLMF